MKKNIDTLLITATLKPAYVLLHNLRMLLTLATILMPFMAWAQDARLFTVQDGLHTSNFKAVDIDSKGGVWLSGARLLTRFDGKSFHDLPTINRDNGKALFSICNGVKEYDDHRFWVYTSNGLFLLDVRKNSFERIMLNEQEDTLHGFFINNVNDYLTTEQVLVTTDGGGTYVIDKGKRKVNIEASQEFINAAGNSFLVCAKKDDRNTVWASTINKQLVAVDLNKMKRKPFEVDKKAEAMLTASVAQTICQCGEKVYFGLSQGLLVYDNATNTVRAVEGLNCTVKALSTSNDGKLYVGTDSYGIWVLDPKDDSISMYRNASAPFDLRYAKVSDLIEDASGNLMVEVMQKGLLVIPNNKGAFALKGLSPADDGKNISCVTSIAFDNDGSQWVGTDGLGVFCQKGDALHTVNEGLRSSLVQTIVMDKRGTLWCGTYGGGVQMLAGGRWTLGTDEWLKPIANELIMHLCYSPDEDAIYVSTNGEGLRRLDLAERKIETYNYESMPNHWLVMSYLDSTGTLWTCSSNRVSFINLKTKKEGVFEYKGQNFFEIDDIKQAGDEIILASSTGLFFHNIKTGATSLVNMTNGLLSNDVRSIVVKDGYVWVATIMGVASINLKTHKVTNYTSFSDHFTGEFHRVTAALSPDGRVMFGGDNGILSFDPRDVQMRKKDISDIFFTSLLIGAENVDYPADSGVLDAAIMYAKTIRLKPSNNSFTITFRSPDISDPDRIHYDYMLKGHETQWHRNTSIPQASYVSLPAGHYTLLVKAYYEDFPEHAVEKSIDVIVDAPWYATNIAIMAYCLMAALLCVIIYRLWKEHKQQKRIIREAQRAREIRDEKLRMFTSITHELKSPLMMIESPLKELTIRETDENKLELYSIMQRNCRKLMEVVKQITDIQKIDQGKFVINLEEHDYVQYANQIFEQFRGTATIKNISFVIEHSEPELHMFFDENHFDKILSNLLSNAFKFTPEGGKIIVRSGIVGGNVELSVYNSGSHFNEEDMKHLFERFYQGSAGNNASGSGIGLNLTNELVKMHNGTITASNIEPDGVEFRLTFPFCNPDFNNLNGRTSVLLIDDNKDIVEYVKSQLEKDCDVQVAFSGNQAWQLLQKHHPDVVVTDYHMPDGDGMELCQNIKSNPETDSIPVIMLTGEGSEVVKLRSLNIQVDHYLEKPVSISLLRSAIAQVLRVRETIRNRMIRIDMGANIATANTSLGEKVDVFNLINESIRKHISDSEFNLDQLSKEVGLSKTQLHRKMKEHYGITANSYIKLYRLKQAAYMLVHNDVNISEVMFAVGFSSPSYFASSFRECFGMSPREFVACYKGVDDEELLKKLLR